MPLHRVLKFFHSKGIKGRAAVPCKHKAYRQEKLPCKHTVVNGPHSRAPLAVEDDGLESCTDNNCRSHADYACKPRVTKASRVQCCNDEDLGTMSEVETSSTPGFRDKRPGQAASNGYLTIEPSPLARRIMGTRSATSTPVIDSHLLFLRYKDETKRVVIHEPLHCLEAVKELFLNAFANSLNCDYVHSALVKVYIQDASKEDLFYELDDLSDIKDRTVLKLHEQAPAPSPSVSDMQVPIYSVQRMEAFDGIEQMELPTQRSSPSFLTPPTQSHMSSPVPTSQCQGRQKEMPMNYYNESEFDGDYRLRKSSSLGMCHYGMDSYAGRFANPKGSLYDTQVGYFGVTKQAIPQSSRKRTSSTVSLSRNHVGNGCRRYSFLPATLQNRKALPLSYAGMRMEKVGPCGCVHADKGYSSEQSDSLSRSGSLTPVIDEETRTRMASMERQLASLSNLVHCALVNKNDQKDCAMLRQNVLDNQFEVNGDSGYVSTEVKTTMHTEKSGHESLPSKQPTESKRILRSAQQNVRRLQHEMSSLRRMAELNCHFGKSLILDMTDKMNSAMSTKKQWDASTAGPREQQAGTGEPNASFAERIWVDQQEQQFQQNRLDLEAKLSDLEQQVDSLREEVVSGKRKLFVAEVEKFSECLTGITRAATSLRDEFPLLEIRLRKLMSAEMEKVVREERFLKEEPARLNNFLKRSKQLTSTMMTMKRLAQIQDESAGHRDECTSKQSPTYAAGSQKFTSALPNGIPSPKTGMAQQIAPMLNAEELSKMAASPKLEEDKPERSTDGHVLDSLLRELQTVAEHSKNLVEHVGVPSNAEKRVGFAEQVKQFPRVEFMNEQDKRATSSANKSLDQRTVTTARKEENLKDKVPDDQEESAKRSWFSMFGRSEVLKMVTAPVHFFQSHPNERKAQSYDPQEAKCTSPQRANANSNAPPPPPRTSSKNHIFDQESVDAAIYSSIEGKSLRHRPAKAAPSGGLSHSFSSSAVPNQIRTLPIIQTSAVDDEPPRFTKSASSSESINSQEEHDSYGSLRKAYSSNCHYKTAGK
uniref:AIP3 domain-containing protein n=1 Tax=Trichuris muris TaxID=70415 RepID=A0A5S6QKJ5_TRIMR